MTGARETVRVRDWIESRTPAPPATLAERLAQIVGDECCESSQLPTVLVNHAKQILECVANDRSYAIDLLAADALITYAMEAIAEACVDPATATVATMDSLASREIS